MRPPSGPPGVLPPGLPPPPGVGPNPNVLSAPPSIMKPPRKSGEEEKKNMATIEAKPQIKNLLGDVTRFMPTTLKVKREGKDAKGRIKIHCKFFLDVHVLHVLILYYVCVALSNCVEWHIAQYMFLNVSIHSNVKLKNKCTGKC